jgi:hypothetical protein
LPAVLVNFKQKKAAPQFFYFLLYAKLDIFLNHFFFAQIFANVFVKMFASFSFLYLQKMLSTFLPLFGYNFNL